MPVVTEFKVFDLLEDRELYFGFEDMRQRKWHIVVDDQKVPTNEPRLIFAGDRYYRTPHTNITKEVLAWMEECNVNQIYQEWTDEERIMFKFRFG